MVDLCLARLSTFSAKLLKYPSHFCCSILEGIRDTIGRKNVVTLKKMIKLEKPQGNRSDPKVLVRFWTFMFHFVNNLQQVCLVTSQFHDCSMSNIQDW